MAKRKNSYPKFSIVVPILNVDRYLAETLQSVFNQNYPDFEVIIQDGGSTDGTKKIIKQFVRKYPKKIIWESKKDKGQTDAINKGFKKASGDIYLYINGDDLLKKNVLKLVAENFRKNSEKLWFVGYGEIVDDKGVQISVGVVNYKNFLIRQNKRYLLLCVNYLTQPATFITKEAYQKYGPFKGVGKIILEYDMWLKLAKNGMPVVIPKTLASFRLVRDSFSATAFKQILKADQEIVARETGNPIILVIHWLNNLSRIALITMLKKI